MEPQIQPQEVLKTNSVYVSTIAGPGDFVYCYVKGYVQHFEVERVEISVVKEETSIRYKLSGLTKLLNQSDIHPDRKIFGDRLMDILEKKD